MLRKLRRPLFIIAFLFILLTVLVEVGSVSILGFLGSKVRGLEGFEQPGKGIFSIVFIDGMLLYTTFLIGLGIIVPEWFQGRVQGVGTFIVMLLVLLAAIAFIFVVFALLMLMITLLLAIPFGTLIYLALYGDFPKGEAEATLGILMTLKLFYAGFLVAAHQRFLQNKGLVLLFFTSLLCNVIINFLLGFPPGFLVSITDAIGAIVVAIIAIIWTIIFLIGSLISVIKALGGIVFIILVIIAFCAISAVVALFV